MKFLKLSYNWFLQNIVGKIGWDFIYKIRGKSYYKLKDRDHENILNVLKNNNCLILIRRNTHLTTYLISFAHLLLTGRWGYWSHACINIEETDLNTFESVDILEAIGEGVVKSDFFNVFDCDSVCLLKPKGYEQSDWEICLKRAMELINTPYDTAFNIKDETRVSCAEYVYVALQQSSKFRKLIGFQKMLLKYKNLSPNMYYECGDFEKILEIRR